MKERSGTCSAADKEMAPGGDMTRVDVSKGDTARRDVSKGDTARIDVPGGDTAKGDTPGANTSKGDVLSARMLAVSRAGHDKDTVYVVLAENGPYLYLADGRRRTLAKPKKKKRMHVQLITHLPADILDAMQDLRCDAHLRKAIRAYEQRVAYTDERYAADTDAKCVAGVDEQREAENGNLSKEESKIRRTVD